MKGIHVTSEISTLKKVLLHRPGNELLNLTPQNLDELLFDDIPFLKIAQKEHDHFAQVLRDNGVEVVYIEDLMAEVLDHDPSLREPFIRQFIMEGGITGHKYTELLFAYLNNNFPGNKELVLKLIEGTRLIELPLSEPDTLIDMVEDRHRVLLLKPLPNLYFQRDTFASVGDGALLHKMYSATRSRETIFAEYIFNHHPDYKGFVKKYFDRYDVDHIEGGDVHNISKDTLLIGISQRTNSDAIQKVARNLFADPESSIRTIYAFNIPHSRAYMHLDTVFSQVDEYKFVYHPGMLDDFRAYRLTPGENGRMNIEKVEDDLETILCSILKTDKVTLIPCGGGDYIAGEREQWNDGSNALTIAPGKAIVYERNEITNELLRKNGIELLEIPSSELSRGRGGPRCMSMPLWRE